MVSELESQYDILSKKSDELNKHHTKTFKDYITERDSIVKEIKSKELSIKQITKAILSLKLAFEKSKKEQT
jgi:superoxide dismutase